MPDIDWVVENVLSNWGRCVFFLFLEKGEEEQTVTYLLAEVDRRFVRGKISFVTAAEAYRLLDPPEWRFRMFPQLSREDSQ